MLYVDDIVIDPEEAPMVPGRTPMSMSEMGIGVVEFRPGEASIEGTAIRTAQGQRLVDRRGKVATVELTLMVREDRAEEVDLPTAAHLLQQKFGSMQERETWIMRVPYVGGDFAGPLLYKITGVVSLGDFLGWGIGEQPDVKLVLERDPVGLSTEEREEGPFTSVAGARHLIFDEDPSPGTADGLWRGRITNEGEEDWRGLILSRECKTAPEDLSDPTAQPHYLAKNLTPKGGAEVKTVEGAEVVQHNALTAGWLTVLSSEIAGEGHMTHLGPRPMWMRIFDPGEEAGGVQLRLLARALGASRWDESLPIVETPVVGGWIPVFLGVPRAEEAIRGDQRWEWKLMARAPGGSGAIRIRDVYPLSTEQYMVLSEREDVEGLVDAESQKLPGSAENAEVPEVAGKAWSNVEGIKTESEEGATAELFGGQATQYIKATNFGFALPGSATPVGVTAYVRKATTAPEAMNDLSVHLVKAGSVVTAQDKRVLSPMWEADQIAIYGGPSDLWGETLTRADINDSGFGLAFAAHNGAAGKVYATVTWIKMAVAYIDGAREDCLCFATRTMEISSDGCFRQHITDDVWGRLVPDGFLPFVQAGGMEKRSTRTIVLASSGDLATTPDGATPSLEAIAFSRDGYQFARGAEA